MKLFEKFDKMVKSEFDLLGDSKENSKEITQEMIDKLLNDPNRQKSLVEQWALDSGYPIDEVGDFIGVSNPNLESFYDQLFENMQSDMEYGNPYQGGLQDTGIILEDTGGKFIQPYKVEALLRPNEKLVRRSNGIQVLSTSENLDSNQIYKQMLDALLFDNDFLKRLGIGKADRGNSRLILEKIGERLGREIHSDMHQLSDEDILDIARLRFEWPSKTGNVAYMMFKLKYKDGSIRTGIMLAHSAAQIIPGRYFENGQWKIDPNNKYNQILEAIQVKDYVRWDDSERKLLLTLLNKFDLYNVENIELNLASEKGFCDSCKKLIGDLLNFIADTYEEKFRNKYPDLIKDYHIPEIIFHYHNDAGIPNGVSNDPELKYKFNFLDERFYN